jgi:hypothetical protein
VLLEWHFVAQRIFVRCAALDVKLVAPQLEDPIFGHVVAQRPEDAIDDCAGGAVPTGPNTNLSV